MKKCKKIATTLLSLVAISLFSACTRTDDRVDISEEKFESDMTTEADDAKEIASNQGIEGLEPVLTFDKAIELFYATYENNRINLESIKFEKDDSGNYRYFIEGWDDSYYYKLEIDVGTAEIIKQEKEIAKKTDVKLDLEAAITPKEAMDSALEGIDQEAVEDWELKVDQNNRMIYEIGFLSGNNQKIDGLSGTVQ